jgi:hypothetical protein
MTLPSDIQSWGSVALGVFIAYLTWYFVSRYEKFTSEGLSAAVTVVAGGVVIAFLDAGLKTEDIRPDAHWWYPIGLLVGFVVFEVLYFIVNRKPAALAPFAK